MARRERTVALPDGRVPAVLERGPRDGAPVVALHGCPGSRLDGAPDLDAALELSRPWDVDVAAVRAPVALWHGDQDVHVPIAHAERTAALVPGAGLRRVAGAGHPFALAAMDELVGELVRR